MPTSSPSTNSQNIAPMHGHVFQPESRAYWAWKAGKLNLGALNQCECGKGFPNTGSGLLDPLAPSDVPNNEPPPDGKIASGNQPAGAILDEARDDWPKHDVNSGDILDFLWAYTARHSTRSWEYFITNPNWDSSQPLSRAQFEATPFFKVQNIQQPYWNHRTEMLPPVPTLHKVPLPARQGYHVVMATWKIAETGNAFYQIVDLLFGAGNRPDKPTGLTVSAVTDAEVVLTWDAGTGPDLIVEYLVIRNGIHVATVQAPLLTWIDGTVDPDTDYTYSIKAVDNKSNVSVPSVPVAVLTLPENGKPHAPTGLHSMGQTANSIDLMWTKSASLIKNYELSRDGVVVRTVPGGQTSVVDTGLTPDTEYKYFLIAVDKNGNQSKPSNTVSVETQGEGGQYPAWALGEKYEVGDKVSHAGKHWSCLQTHPASTPDWAPDKAQDVLWKE